MTNSYTSFKEGFFRRRRIFLYTALLLSFFVLVFFSINPLVEKPKVLDCNSPPNVFYLKPSETSIIQEILKDPNAVVVIPELDRLQANTELLGCDTLDVGKYINLGGFD